jgi:UPF0716 family protein affecting phage T7 exclusion
MEPANLAALLFIGIVTGVFGLLIADNKGRSKVEGFPPGFFLSLLGLVVEFLLPMLQHRYPGWYNFTDR